MRTNNIADFLIVPEPDLDPISRHHFLGTLARFKIWDERLKAVIQVSKLT